LRELPALLIVGPRATGKTTTALRHAATTVRLDQPAQAAAFLADPDAALRGLEEPVLLDEWQVVPEVLGAVKRSVDMLINLRVAEAVPSWTSNRLKRLVQAPKRYLVDPALLAALLAGVLRVDAAGVMRDGNLLGRVLDTFVAAQLRAQLPVRRAGPGSTTCVMRRGVTRSTSSASWVGSTWWPSR
jgi:predicted AAA+ superfamily ATPase